MGGVGGGVIAPVRVMAFSASSNHAGQQPFSTRPIRAELLLI
jgi:hypothetical protein